jgi:hypothetical protein
MKTKPGDFVQVRFRWSRHKVWDEYGFVISNQIVPPWIQDGLPKYADSSSGIEARHSSDGTYFNVWDMPGFRELLFWEDFADIAIQFSNFEMKFYENGLGELTNLKLQYHTKVHAKWDWDCDIGITGSKQAGMGLLSTIPDWPIPPSGL